MTAMSSAEVLGSRKTAQVVGIRMIRKAARFRVASRSGTPATGWDIIEERQNSQLALLTVLGHVWSAQLIDVSMPAIRMLVYHSN